MKSTNRKFTVASLLIFVIAALVYFMSAERTGSLWDCGEFILAAYKLQVVHPPGAPLFLLIGRMFAWMGDLVSSDPSTIAFAVNLMSGIFTAAAAALVGHSTMLLSTTFFKKEEEELSNVTIMVCAAGGIVAGLATAFSSSIWFSAVEGEVYAMSTFFTALTAWAVIKWYSLPNDNKYDKWLVFSAYSAGLSLGVHLLSLLTFPALALFIYFKKSKSKNWTMALVSAAAGAASIPLIQKLIIVGIPELWKGLDVFMVNTIGAPFNSGIVPTLLIVGGVFFVLFRYARQKGHYWMQLGTMAALMISIGYSTIGIVVVRANADTPVNMNVPSDPSRLVPYLNREQYGERALLFGPHYGASAVSYDRERRKGRVDFPPFVGNEKEEYVYVDEKIKAQYNSKDKMFFPRIGHSEMGRPGLYKQWHEQLLNGQAKPSFGFNFIFFLKYQIGWMYTRYFMWNFAGRQNGSQGYFSWDKSSGHWQSGLKIIDEGKLYNMDEEPETLKAHKGSNKYFFLPLIFGLIGLFYHSIKQTKDFAGLFALFLVTGLGIIVYSNQPPNEPRERDYVLVGSFFTFCIWIGMAVPAIYKMVADRYSLKGIPVGAGIAALVLTAPLIMGWQNFDDHSRNGHYGSRDYAKNFLNSLEPNAIIFTYGDNDTYPLWYVQEVEDVRRDVRIVNLSLIAVDWYINKLRRKVNDAPGIKLTIPPESYRGNKRNQLPFGGENTPPVPLENALKFIGERHPVQAGSISLESYLPSREFVIPTNYQAAQRMGMYDPRDSTLNVVPDIRIKFSESKTWITKDDLAVMDIIGSNIWERPIYFATTCQNSKLLGLNDYMQYEGLALRIVPIKTPSDRSMSIYGSGRVATDKAYDNIMNKWQWGNFDKKDVFINDSYGAAIQAHRMVMLRTAQQFLEEGNAQGAVDISDQFFKGFPHFNFPYTLDVLPFIQIYVRTGQHDKAKEHLRILAAETKDFLEFYESIDPITLQNSFARDFGRRQSEMSNALNLAGRVKDEAFKQEIEGLLGQYRSTSVPN